MADKLETRKYTFTVEGETEQWYFLWLRDQINLCQSRTYNVTIDVRVQQSPRKFYKSVNAKTTPRVTHVCDMKSGDPIHVKKFQTILSDMKEARDQKNIDYDLGYSHFEDNPALSVHEAVRTILKECGLMA